MLILRFAGLRAASGHYSIRPRLRKCKNLPLVYFVNFGKRFVLATIKQRAVLEQRSRNCEQLVCGARQTTRWCQFPTLWQGRPKQLDGESLPVGTEWLYDFPKRSFAGIE